MLARLAPGSQGLQERIESGKSQNRSGRADSARETLEGVAAKSDLLGECHEGEKSRFGQEPSPGTQAEGEANGNASAHRHHGGAENHHAPAQCQTKARFADPARPPRQSLGADGVCLAVERKPHAGIAKQKQKDQHGLFDQGSPLFAGQPQCPVASQSPRQEVVEERDDELHVGAETAVGNAGAGHGRGTAGRGLRPSGAKAPFIWLKLMYGLKPVPFTQRDSPQAAKTCPDTKREAE